MKNTFYIPQTATPFRQNNEYTEILPQNPELAKYIRCFWGSSQPYLTRKDALLPSLVVPDTCVDIIYNVDHTANTVIGSFCGINDRSFAACDNVESGHLVSIFGIRFYGWHSYAFSEDSLKDTTNGFFDISSRFRWLDRILRPQLLEKASLKERIAITEALFLQRLFHPRKNSVVASAVNQIIMQKGALNTAQLANESFVSSRQLERVFHEYVGITPKKLINLIRYQFLWNEILRNPDFNILDGVFKYGYSDQAHLSREFKRYHTMNIQAAKIHAYNDVGAAQDSPRM